MRDNVRLSQIVQGKNPRTYFDPQEMAELEAGIRAYGVLQPILVRPFKMPGTASIVYEIIAGERRWRAAKNVFGDDYDMPVVILDVADIDADAIAVIENHHRSDVSAAEVAQAAQRQLYRNNGDKEETARQLGWKIALLERRMALLACTPTVLKALSERRILVGHAELLAGVPSTTQDKVLDGIIAHKVPVSVLKKQLAQFARRLSDAIFDTAQCTHCEHNSARQAGLFDESLGDGYCQNPAHFDDLTMQAVGSKAAGLKDEYQVVKIVKATDGFTPLHLKADGDLGVGNAQYQSCKGCASFGCAISAMPGSYGQVTASLCFDVGCNTQKVAARRKAEKQTEAASTKGSTPTNSSGSSGKSMKPQTGKTAGKTTPTTAQPSNKPSQRVLQHRVTLWRKWLANALMQQTERNQRLLIALALSGHLSDCSQTEYGAVLNKLTHGKKNTTATFGGALHLTDELSTDLLPRLIQAIAASAAFGVDEQNLQLLLNYLDIDEAQHFVIDKEFLNLFTMNELESLAGEIGLRKAMGERFAVVRAGKKDAFIAALLAVKNFAYKGTVPSVMRYTRTPFANKDKPQVKDAAVDQSRSENAQAITTSDKETQGNALAVA
jgi:PRTRC genetic system ParB family protein